MLGRRLFLSFAAALPALWLTDGAAAAQNGGQAYQRDRAAILAMAGEYRVSFQFHENLALAPGYSLSAPQDSGARELVIVVEDAPARIVLQHLLLDGHGGVIKHWRQDWEYEQPRFWRYAGHNAWERREEPQAAVSGAWVQTVWQVEDSPRYAGIGRWEHDYGVSRWTSDQTWRPLPRREHTKRDDYNVLVGVNRHTITPEGWVHEQDNYKLDYPPAGEAGAARYLAHEVGANTYRRTGDVDFQPAHEYWQATRVYWAAVREFWSRLFARHESIELQFPGDGKDDAYFIQRLMAAIEISDRNPDAAALAQEVERSLRPLIKQVR